MKRRIALPILLSIAAAGAVTPLWFGGVFAGMENFFEDTLFTASALSPEIVVVDIDDASLQKLGQWPWPRAYFGKLLRNLNRVSPQSVGIDVIFAEPSRFGAPDDADLSFALSEAPYPVVLPAEAVPLILTDQTPRAGTMLTPLSIFTKHPSVAVGHVNLILDRDNIVRRFPTAIAYGDAHINAFAYEVAKAAEKTKSGKKESAMRTVDLRFSEHVDSFLPLERIVYRAPARTVKRVPFYRLIEETPPASLKGAIVLVGASAADLHDEKPTPLSRGTAMPGVEIQANILNMFLTGERLAPLPSAITAAWIFAAALAPLLFFWFFRNLWVFLGTAAALGVLETIAAILLFEYGYVAPLVHTNLSLVLSTTLLTLYRYLALEKEKIKIKKMFSKYVSREVLAEILLHQNEVVLGGVEKEITVLFSDIRGFTTLSEATQPAELVALLNEYFTLMADEIMRHQGVVDKYIGDAVMAFWGAPLENTEQAHHAVLAARGMMEQLKKFNAKLAASGKHPIDIGIGIYTGPAIAGNIGSRERFNYTVIGDTVNIASRLEGLNKEYKTNIIIGETTKRKLPNTIPVRELGTTLVKGRTAPLAIYGVDATTASD